MSKKELEILQNLLKSADGDKDEENEDEEGGEKKMKKAKETDPDEKNKSDEDKNDLFNRESLKKAIEENPEIARQCAEELGMVLKAQDDVSSDIKDKIEEAEMIVVDGTDFFKAQSDVNASILKALEAVNKRLESLEGIGAIVFQSHDLVKASANLLAKAHEEKGADEEIVPQPKRAVDTAMIKAKEQKELPGLTKAKDMNYREIRRMVFKAIEAGDSVGLNLATPLDSCGGNLARLHPDILKAIDSLVDKYGNKE